jgi:hypothetical protein
MIILGSIMVRKKHISTDEWKWISAAGVKFNQKEFIERAMDGWMISSMIGFAVPLLVWLIFFCINYAHGDESFETIFNMCVFQRVGSARRKRTTRSQRSIFCRLSQGRGREEFMVSLLFCLPQFRHPFFFLFPFFSCNCAIFYDCPFFLSIT